MNAYSRIKSREYVRQSKKQRRTIMKKIKAITSLILAILMTLGFGTTALAASSPETMGTITITNAKDGETYTIYKIFDLTYDGEEGNINSYSYTVSENWINFLKNETYADYFTLTEIDGSYYLDPSSKIFTQDDNGEFMSAFAKSALEYAKANNIQPEASATAANGRAVFSNLNLGYYLADTTLGSLCMLRSTAPTAEVDEKNGVPTPVKYVDLIRDETVENSSTHEYEIYIENIRGVSHMSLEDIMDPELTLKESENKADTFTVAIVNDEGKTLKTLTYGVDFTYAIVKTTDDQTLNGHKYVSGSTDIHIYFYSGDYPDGETYSEFDFSPYSNTDKVLITYNCEVDTEDDPYEGDYDELLNSVQLSYAAAAMSDWIDAEVELFGFEIKKTDSDGNALSDAEFELENEQGQTAYFITEDIAENNTAKKIYLFEGWGHSGANGASTSLIAGEDGMIYIEGLDAGTYTVKETKAPNGYNKLSYDFTVTISDGSNEGENKGDVFLTTDQTGNAAPAAAGNMITVINTKGSMLPGTGGIGSTVFYVGGAVLLLGAVILLIDCIKRTKKA